MKAVFWSGQPFEVAVKQTPFPKILQPGDAIVRLTTTSICGSDLHTYHGVQGSPNVPYSMGHEGVGVVVEVGHGVKAVKVGNRVIVPDVAVVGRFDPNPHLNFSSELFGGGSIAGDLGGTQAEAVRVPNADENLTIVPNSSSQDLDFVLLSDIFCTAWGGLDYTGFQSGDTVVVFGAGPVGLLVAYSAILRGANKVYSVDHVQARLDKAASIGAVPINITQGSPSKQILEFEPNGVARVADAVGEECVNSCLEPQEGFVLQEAINIASVNGGIGIIGIYFPATQNNPGQPNATRIPVEIPINIGQFWTKGLTIKGGVVDPHKFIPILLPLIQSGRAKPSFVFSTEIGIDDAPSGYDRFSKHLETKVAIRFPWETKESHKEPGIHEPTSTR